MEVFSYGDIQTLYDGKLKENREWSIFVLQEGIPYYNTFRPPKKKYDNDQIMAHLLALCFIYRNSKMEASLHNRLMASRHEFEVSRTEFIDMLDEVTEWYDSGNATFVPNAMARSIRNPYYKFDTRLSKPEVKKLQQEHRRQLKALYLNPELDVELYEMLTSYDLNEGLLSREKLKKLLQTSRYNLDRCFERNNFLQQMYEDLRTASYKPSYKKRRL